MPVATAKVDGRRQVHYASLDDLLADADQLAAGDPRMLGNWTLGQVLGHLARAMHASIDGFPGKISWPMRMLARLLMRKMLLDGPLRPGFKLPPDAERQMVPPPDISAEEGLQALKSAVERLKSETKRTPHLALGRLSVQDWNRAHLRHAELHLSFAVPQ